MVQIEFIKEYAGKKRGEKDSYDGQLAASLISKKVAKLVKTKK